MRVLDNLGKKNKKNKTRMFSENLVLSPENVSPFPFETNRGHCSSIRYMVSAGAGASQDHSTLSDDLPKSNLLPSSFHSGGTFCSKPVYSVSGKSY